MATTILISGANTGIGYEIVRALCRSESKTYQIILCGRSLPKADEAAAAVRAEYPETTCTITTLQLDIADDASIAAAAATVEEQFGHIDVLVNNAGAAFDGEIATGAMGVRAAFNKTFDVNVTGTHIATDAFAPLLLKGHDRRLLFITSGASSIAETCRDSPRNAPPAAGWPKDAQQQRPVAYFASKTALNMVMREWARVLRSDGVKVFAVAPGLLLTGLGGNREALVKMGAKEPWIGGESVRSVVEGGRDVDAGLVVRNYASPVQPW